MKTHRRIHFTALFALAAGWLDITPAQAQLSVQWITHYGTTAEERGNAIAVDGLGQSWVTGYTYGSLGGTHAGSTINADIFLTRLSPTGNVDFNRQRGGTGDETGYGVALVGSGTVFAGGAVSSSTIDGQGSGGSLEVRYDTSGNWQGTTRFGVTDSYTFGLAGNATGLLMAGNAYGSFDGQTHLGGGDAFLSKRDSTGALVWTRFVGTASQETGRAAAFDSAGNAYLIGETYGNIVGANRGSLDFFITRYDSAGNLTLLRQLGSNGYDFVSDIEVDVSGNIFLAGYTEGNLGGRTNAGGYDAFVMKLNSAGGLVWTRLLGGTSYDYGTAIGVDGTGNVWVGGYTSSNFSGHINAGSYDGFVAEYDTSGVLLGTSFLASSGDDIIAGLAVGPDGSAYVTGYTGSLGGPNIGSSDVFVAKIVPEPSTALLLLGGGALLALRRRR